MVEHTPRDKYWGDGGDGGTGARGLNTLGKLLMKVRDEVLKSIKEKDEVSELSKKDEK